MASNEQIFFTQREADRRLVKAFDELVAHFDIPLPAMPEPIPWANPLGESTLGPGGTDHGLGGPGRGHSRAPATVGGKLTQPTTIATDRPQSHRSPRYRRRTSMPQPRLTPQSDSADVARKIAEAGTRTETAIREIMLRLDLTPWDALDPVDPRRRDLVELRAYESNLQVLEGIRDALVKYDIDVAAHWSNLP